MTNLNQTHFSTPNSVPFYAFLSSSLCSSPSYCLPLLTIQLSKPKKTIHSVRRDLRFFGPSSYGCIFLFHSYPILPFLRIYHPSSMPLRGLVVEDIILTTHQWLCILVDMSPNLRVDTLLFSIHMIGPLRRTSWHRHLPALPTLNSATTAF